MTYLLCRDAGVRWVQTKENKFADSFHQVDTELLPAEENPWGNAFTKKETPLETETGRVVDSTKARFWKISNPAKHHEYSGASQTIASS